jgi:putative peptide zinc metalloprotease protein
MNVLTPQLRSDLRFIEQVYRGEKSYVVKDLTAQRYFRFGATEVRVMRAFDGRRTFGEIVAYLADQGLRVSSQTVEQFARKLASGGFLERTLAERSTLELERLRAERRQRRRRRLFRGELLRMRWSFGDPNALLDRVLPAIRWMFTPAFIVASVVLFSLYLAVLGQRFPEYTAALQSTYAPSKLSPLHVAIFIASGLAVILIHELGHGFTCKYFGGEVHELGFMLLYFQPAFYCNVTDAWSFPDRRARLWVTAAGSWIQLVVAAIAALVWWASAPGTLIAEVSVAAMFVGGVMTLLTNANPLLPLDGYFALTDWLEIPNLRQRALAHIGWWIRQRVFRLEQPEPAATARERRIFFIYGGLAATYIVLTLSLFAAFVLGWATVSFGAIGTVLAAGWLLLLMQTSVMAWMRTSVLSIRTHRSAWKRRLRSRTTLVFLLSILVIGFLVPRPLTTTGGVVFGAMTARTVTAADSGVIAEVLADEGQRVLAGTPVLRLVDYSVARDRVAAARAVDSLAAAEITARAAGHDADAEALAANRRSQEGAWAALERHAERLILRAPVTGAVVTTHPENLVGRQVHPGDSLLTLVTLDTLEARIALTGAGATRVRPGDVVHLVSYANASAVVTARVHDVSTQAIRSDTAGGAAVEVRVRLSPNEAWLPGSTGEASVVLARSTVWGALWWKLRQWLRSDLLL